LISSAKRLLQQYLPEAAIYWRKIFPLRRPPDKWWSLTAIKSGETIPP
jgi:hypothetical protein